jgi:hypothetical protein
MYGMRKTMITTTMNPSTGLMGLVTLCNTSPRYVCFLSQHCISDYNDYLLMDFANEKRLKA